MTSLRVRIDRLELVHAPAVLGRFVTVRAGRCDEASAQSYLAGHGIQLRPEDMLLLDTHAEPGASGHVGVDEPISHHVIASAVRFEEALDLLD